jgi:glycosyltransferase involved in cell wall biosynthesis
MMPSLKTETNASVVLFLSTYPPRPCGIATYTQDLVHALTLRFGESLSPRICALEEGAVSRTYPPEVVRTLDATNWRQYIELADEVNEDEAIKAVFVQHEFGLFSGPYGEDLLFFLLALRKPVLVTFHTVLPKPARERREIVRAITNSSEAVTVMTEHSKRILASDYAIDPQKITVIPHGTHTVLWKDKGKTRMKFGLQGKLVLSTFGLLSPNKSIETALRALPEIRRQFPNVLYLVLGRTHPGVVASEGEAYRKSLQKLVKELAVQEHVRFVNRYLQLDELLDYLRATDVYLFTSKDHNQAVSGTLSYAMGCGCPVVSTRMPQAVEVLRDGAGVLIDFSNPEQLASETTKLLSDKDLLERIGLRAMEQTRTTAWLNVATSYARLIAHATGTKLKYSWPEISLDHLRRMTDNTGIIQFSRISEPDPQSGYTLDDNARALVAACLHYVRTRDEEVKELIGTYLNFIRFCQRHDGSFLNYVDQHGVHSEMNDYVNLQDANGRAVWALGYVLSLKGHFPVTITKQAEEVLRRALPTVSKLTSPRAMSFAIKGLCCCNKTTRDHLVTGIVMTLANRILDLYNASKTSDWKWFEPYLTYGNAVIPEALLRAYVLTGRPAYRQVARTSFDFLLSKTFRDGKLRVISNRGWLSMGSDVEQHGEQPIDAAYTVIALESFWKAYKNPEYLRKLHLAFEWFLGRNHLGLMVYNPVSGGCHDGLEEENVNLNQGAESTVCYLMARLTMESVKETAIKTRKRLEPTVATPNGMRRKPRKRLRAQENHRN